MAPSVKVNRSSRTAYVSGTMRDEPFKGEQLASEWKGLRRLRVGHRKDVYRHG